jgi:uncharacterized membrane protein YphA (DoxX/SURF4 family)
MIRISAWTALFLVLLRLAIGWHFAYEGYHKIHSQDTAAPFTSEAYFREAEGPLGGAMRRVVGDADDAALARLTPKPAGDANPRSRLPDAMEQEFNGYLQRFETSYPISETQKQEAAGKLDQAKDQTVRWLLGHKDAGGEKEVERKAPSGNATVKRTMTTPERVEEYRTKLREVRDLYDQKLPLFGKDVEKLNLRTKKAEVAALRTDLLDDLNKQITAMKDALASIVRLPADGSLPLTLPENVGPEQYLADLLTPAGEKTEPATEANLPKELARQWDAYYDQFTKAYPIDPDKQERAKQIFHDEKAWTARWLLNEPEMTGTPPPAVNMPERTRAYRAKLAQVNDAVKSDPKGQATLGYRAEQIAMMPGLYGDLDQRTTDMKKALDTALTPDQAKGYSPDPPKSRILSVAPNPFSVEGIDWMTRWGLTILGGCLLVGLFTRLSCLGAAGFLLMTYLLVPPFPWLPQPPLNEGNYLFVNKNVVEMLALLALATTRSGKWFGLDALIGAIFRRRPKREGDAIDAVPVERPVRRRRRE